MEYQVHTIGTRAELPACPVFLIDHFQWTCRRRPAAWGRMGYLRDTGLCVELVCEERDPLRVYHNPQDPVCRDSALEAFFAFGDLPGEPVRNDGFYCNFELNANGAMYAKLGRGRKNRRPLTPEEYALCAPRAQLGAQSWSVELTVPEALLASQLGRAPFSPGGQFVCNFYKISESPDIEHYASFSPVDSEKPNFHLPECFARAVLI